MVERCTPDARAVVTASVVAETSHGGDPRVGTEHLLTTRGTPAKGTRDAQVRRMAAAT